MSRLKAYFELYPGDTAFLYNSEGSGHRTHLLLTDVERSRLRSGVLYCRGSWPWMAGVRRMISKTGNVASSIQSAAGRLQPEGPWKAGEAITMLLNGSSTSLFVRWCWLLPKYAGWKGQDDGFHAACLGDLDGFNDHARTLSEEIIRALPGVMCGEEVDNFRCRYRSRWLTFA